MMAGKLLPGKPEQKRTGKLRRRKPGKQIMQDKLKLFPLWKKAIFLQG